MGKKKRTFMNTFMNACAENLMTLFLCAVACDELSSASI